MNKEVDVIIVGTGAAGLYCALSIPKERKIWMYTKSGVEESDSFLAQGGICVLKDESDYDSFFEDTLRAGHYENKKDSVVQMIRSSRQTIFELESYGVEFEKNEGGFCYTKEGAHSSPRILYHEDETGKEITSKLLAEVRKRENIKIFEHMEMLDLITEQNRCTGIVVRNQWNLVERVDSDYVVLATGGVGGLFHESTNYSHLTGDAVAIALDHGIKTKDLNYVQIHPTSLFSKKKGRRFLISESVRGEGAILLNQKKERFVDELLPRDLLTEKIKKQIEMEGSEYVWLSLEHIGDEQIRQRFPNIYKRCMEEGYDLTKECIPVVPAQHYFMGGIEVDLDSRTSMQHLFAIGETSCNGVHGANRLASNSLLESLVFANKAACYIKNNYERIQRRPFLNMKIYQDFDQMIEKRKAILKDRMERSKEHDKQHHTRCKCG